MRVAFECPTDLLEVVQPFADFDWILADRFLEDEKYAQYYTQSTNFKVVDNSVTEKGEPLDPAKLIEVVEAVKADAVVSPDWINDFQRTVEAYLQFKETKFNLETQPIIAGVLQGSTPEEALQCLPYYDAQLVLVPYRVGGSEKNTPNWIKALKRVLVVKHINTNTNVHLLGFTTTDEFRWYAGMKNVVSIDTDVPIKAGLAKVDIDDFDRSSDEPKVVLNKDTWAGICRNIALFRKETNV